MARVHPSLNYTKHLEVGNHYKVENMKKNIIIFSSIILLLTACQEEQFDNSFKLSNYYASIQTYETDTKTALTEGNKVIWSEGDQINIYNESGAIVYSIVESSIGSSTGEFKEDYTLIDEPFELDKTVAFHSTSETNLKKQDNKISFEMSFQQWQTYSKSSFDALSFPMVATCPSTDNRLYFDYLVGILKLSLTGSGSISQITLTGNSDEILSGNATVILDRGVTPSIQMIDNEESSRAIDLCCTPAIQLDPLIATDFYITLPPTEFMDGFTITVTDDTGRKTVKKTNNRHNIGISEIRTMPEFRHDSHELKQMLSKLYQETDGDNWYHNDNWCTDAPISDWYGITMDSDGTFVLDLYDNNLNGKIELLDCKLITSLNIIDNKIYSINLSGCTNLKSLLLKDMWDTGTLSKYIENITLTNCTSLEEFKFLGDNSEIWGGTPTPSCLHSIDIKGCSSLKSFSCGYANNLTNIDFDDCKEIDYISISNTGLNSINLNNTENISQLDLSNNCLKELELCNLNKLEFLCIDGNPFNKVIIDNCNSLSFFDHSSECIESLSITNCSALTRLLVNESGLKTIHLDNLPMIEEVDLHENELKSCTLNNMPQIKTLNLDSNEFTSFTLPLFTNLESFIISHNKLTNLNLDAYNGANIGTLVDCQYTHLNFMVPSFWYNEIDLRVLYDHKYSYGGGPSLSDPDGFIPYHYYKYEYGCWKKGEPKEGYEYKGEGQSYKCDCEHCND